MDIASRFIGRNVAVWGRNATVGTSLEELYAYDQPLSWPAILPAAASGIATGMMILEVN